jgi:hypothetical protein
MSDTFTDGLPRIAAGNTVATLAPTDVRVAAAEYRDDIPTTYFPPTPMAPATQRLSDVGKTPAPVLSGQPLTDALTSVTKRDLKSFKDQVNDSFGEIANLLLELQTRFSLLDERLDKYNQKSSHKI